MAIRNTLLGGTDFINGENLITTDLNDTFDEIARLCESTY